MNKTILVFEEDNTLCDLLKSFLEEDLHLKVLCTHDTDEIFSIMEVNKIDILVLGLTPYNQNKVEGVINLAKNYYKTKVAVLSTFGDPTKFKEKLNADYGLLKPFEWDEFSAIFI